METGSVSERIAQMVEHFHKGNKSAFAKAVGISNQSLGEIVGARQSAPSFTALQKILTAFPEVRMEWLVMGKGEMLPPLPPFIDPFGYRNDEEKRSFLPTSFIVAYEEDKKRRDKEWEEYHAAVKAQKQSRTVIKAVFERLAEKDPSIREILDALPTAFEDIIDPDQMEQLIEAQHEEWDNELRAAEETEQRQKSPQQEGQK